MSVRPVLFEDHTAARFRPLAWSVPVPEIRCGLFCLRERLGLLRPGGGVTAVRPGLRPLGTDPAWRPIPSATAAGRDLWLNGRLAPAAPLLADLLAAAAVGPFAWTDEAGLLALAADPPLAAATLASWETWREQAEEQPGDAPAAWRPALPAEWEAQETPGGGRWLRPGDAGPGAPGTAGPALGWIWDLVPRTAAAIAADLVLAGGRRWRRHPFGLVPAAGAADPIWAAETALAPASPPGVAVRGEGGLFLGPDTDILPGTVIDTRPGPVVLDRGVRVGAHVFLEGPLYLGPGCRVKAGACLYGESSYGTGCRVAGEVGESTFGDFANKQHEGFIGHAVLGSWVNLGAMTTCSDLKNNYGPVRVDLGWGAVDTGLRFVGLLMGDHAKTAIGTLFNTGTVVGFAANVFGDRQPPKHVPSFSWGGQAGDPAYDVEKAVATARVVLSRRGCELGPDHAFLFRSLASL